MCRITNLPALLFLIITNASCYASTYQLMISNNTDELFKVQAADSGILPDLYPHVSDGLYRINWQKNNLGIESFSLRFISVREVGLELYVIGTRSDASQKIFCTSGSIRYACQLFIRDEAAANLVISYR